MKLVLFYYGDEKKVLTRAFKKEKDEKEIEDTLVFVALVDSKSKRKDDADGRLQGVESEYYEIDDIDNFNQEVLQDIEKKVGSPTHVIFAGTTLKPFAKSNQDFLC